MEWKTIDSAPKDGALVLIGNPEWDVVWQASFREMGTAGSYKWQGWTRFNSYDLGLIPTHWMPLPEPPKETV